MNTGTQGGKVLPARAGLGLKPEHIGDIIATGPDVGFFEVHAENYMGDGGAPHRALAEITSRYPLSLHGVGLSIGAERPLDKTHLARLKRLIDRYKPHSFSEHLAWSTHDTGFLNDLLPVPYTKQTLERRLRAGPGIRLRPRHRRPDLAWCIRLLHRLIMETSR